MLITQYTRFGSVEGLGDEEIPWWIAPYVRDFTALAKSSAILEGAASAASPSSELARSVLASRLVQTAAIARVAALTEGAGKQMLAGASAAMAADVDEFCGTPPRPHHVNEAALAVAFIAANLRENDPAKAVLVTEAQRLQQRVGTR